MANSFERAFLAVALAVGGCGGSSSSAHDGSVSNLDGGANDAALPSGDLSLSSTTPNVAQPGTAIVSRGQVIPLAPGAINGAVLGMTVASAGAVHYATPPVQWNYDAVAGLTKVGPGEYFIALLMSDGSVQIPAGDTGTEAITPFTFPSGTMISDVAGGLHNGVFLDSAGTVWTWGTSWSGMFSLAGDGSGDLTGALKHIQNDATSAPFTNVVSVQGGGSFDAAIKSDGTLWIWGDTTGGFSGDGTNGGPLNSATQVPFPSGTKIKQIWFSDIAIALDSNGGVWTWGGATEYGLTQCLGRSTGNNMTPGQVTGLPTNVVSLAAGGRFSYALTADGKLYGWGFEGDHLGAGTANWQQVGAVDLAQYLNLPKPVQAVAANNETTHVILTDGTLWGWGDDAYGGVGDGQELDYSKTMNPYAWDWGASELMIYKPIQIAKTEGTFKAIYKNNVDAFYTFAVTTDGHLYSWGRNKTANLMNGIIGANPVDGVISATFPNSWDILVPMKVNPTQYKNVEVSSPECLITPTVNGCQSYNIMTGMDQ